VLDNVCCGFRSTFTKYLNSRQSTGPHYTGTACLGLYATQGWLWKGMSHYVSLIIATIWLRSTNKCWSASSRPNLVNINKLWTWLENLYSHMKGFHQYNLLYQVKCFLSGEMFHYLGILCCKSIKTYTLSCFMVLLEKFLRACHKCYLFISGAW